jgi:hypothetical protein
MRILKFILGIGCLIAAIIPSLLVLGELTFFFNWVFALCALGLIGTGLFLITMRGKALSSKVAILTGLNIFILMGFVVVIVVPAFVAGTRFRQANPCINNLMQIQSAKDQWKLENNKKDGDVATEADLKPYFKDEIFPKCPAGGTYIIGRVDENPKCSIGTSAWPNDHVFPGDDKENWWTNFKAAYSILFGLNHVQKS